MLLLPVFLLLFLLLLSFLFLFFLLRLLLLSLSGPVCYFGRTLRMVVVAKWSENERHFGSILVQFWENGPILGTRGTMWASISQLCDELEL